MGFLINTDSSIHPLLPKGKTFSVEEIRAVTGGHFEIVNDLIPGTYHLIADLTDTTTVIDVRGDDYLIVNAQGKLNALPVNWIATQMHSPGLYGPIVGPALLCHNNEIE